jgi:hypothetical protein
MEQLHSMPWTHSMLSIMVVLSMNSGAPEQPDQSEDPRGPLEVDHPAGPTYFF